MKKLNNVVFCTVGIYNTSAQLTRHRNGDCTVRLPEVRWVGNTGSLAFSKVRLTGKGAALAREMFDADEVFVSDGENMNENLWDLCAGNYGYLH